MKDMHPASTLDLLEITKEIVDSLLPELTPAETSLYLH